MTAWIAILLALLWFALWFCIVYFAGYSVST